MHSFKKIFLLFIPIFIMSCSDSPEELSESIVDLRVSELGGQEQRVSYVEDFDNNDIDNWEALLYYGNAITSEQEKEPKNSIIFFVISDDLDGANEGSDGQSLRTKVFAYYSRNSNGKHTFSINPYNSFEESFYQTYKENKLELKNKYSAIH